MFSSKRPSRRGISSQQSNLFCFSVTGVAPPPMFTEPPIVQDTPRTYRSDLSTARIQAQKALEQQAERKLLTAQDTLDAMNKAFTYFRKAIVRFPSSVIDNRALTVLGLLAE